MNTSQPHLNDDQFTACALGEQPDAPAAAHLAACETCRAEVELFFASSESFNRSSLAWSKAQPTTSLRPLAHERRAQSVWAVASWALAGCIAVVSTVSIAAHRHAEEIAAASFAAEDKPLAPETDSAAQIARDNKLLAAVYAATSSRAISPLEEYSLEAPPPVEGERRTARNSDN